MNAEIVCELQARAAASAQYTLNLLRLHLTKVLVPDPQNVICMQDQSRLDSAAARAALINLIESKQ